MAEAIIAAATAVGTWVSNTVIATFGAGAAGGGASGAVAGGVGIGGGVVGGAVGFAAAAAGLVAETLVYTGASAAATALAAPDMPKAEAGKVALKQTMPLREFALSPCRKSGAFMLWESDRHTFDVYAVVDQRATFGDKWLHDDKVTVTSNIVQRLPGGAYGGNRVKMFFREGALDQLSFTADAPTIEFNQLATGTWTEDHRLAGIAAVCISCEPQDMEGFHKTYPQGVPVGSFEVFPGICDFRILGTDPGEHDPEDDATWESSDNPIAQIGHLLTGLYPGEEKDAEIAAVIEPFLADWIQAADDCDDPIDLNAGGTEPRYRSRNLWFRSSTPEAEVLGNALQACDGWMCEAGDGSVKINAGYYRAPTVTLDGNRIGAIKSLEYTRGRPSEQAVNDWPFKWVSVEQDYSSVPGDPWRNAAVIDEVGDLRSQPVEFICVPSHSQGRRLLKRRDLRANPLGYGAIVYDLGGLEVIGEQYINFDFVDGTYDELDGAVLEILGPPRVDLTNMTVSFAFLHLDVDQLNAWDKTTEEGEAPEIISRHESEELAEAVIVLLEPHETLAKVYISVNEDPDTNNFGARYRQTGEESWTEVADVTATDVGGGVRKFLMAPFLAWDIEYEICARAVDGDVYGDWSAPETITLTEPGGP